MNDHSKVTTIDSRTVLEISPMSISDWPDIANRSILWSYRCSARTSQTSMREIVALLSKLRINMILLTIDSYFGNTSLQDADKPESSIGEGSEVW